MGAFLYMLPIRRPGKGQFSKHLQIEQINSAVPLSKENNKE